MSPSAGLAMIGKSITQKEDLRLLTGRGSYVEDVQMPGLPHVSFLRSPHAATAERAEAVAGRFSRHTTMIWSR